MKRAALVTGASRRVGRAFALFLASLGYDIALHYHRSRKEAIETLQEVQAYQVNGCLLEANLEEVSEVKALIAEAKKAFPHLELLINNASLFEHSSLTLKDLPALERHWKVHVQAPYILTADFQELVGKGQIVNILDTHITRNVTAHFAYLLSKKSLADFTQMAAVALAPTIRVNGIAPGLTLPPDHLPQDFETKIPLIPLKKSGSPSHLVQALDYLLKNDYVTGQILFVDGGEHLM